jgi:hypothetical protein
MPHGCTVNFKGEKQVAMKTTGYEKLHVTVMLSLPSVKTQQFSSNSST